jgi:hypothetical protein
LGENSPKIHEEEPTSGNFSSKAKRLQLQSQSLSSAKKPATLKDEVMKILKREKIDFPLTREHFLLICK